MNSFRRPVLSSAISYHYVSSAAPACGSSAHSSATLRAEKKRRIESHRGRGRSSRRSDPGAVNGTRPITERGEEDNPGQAARTERPWRTRPWLERPSRSRRGTCRAGPVTARRERPCRSRRGTRRPGRARPGGRGAPCAGEPAQESLLGGEREGREPHARCAPGDRARVGQGWNARRHGRAENFGIQACQAGKDAFCIWTDL